MKAFSSREIIKMLEADWLEAGWCKWQSSLFQTSEQARQDICTAPKSKLSTKDTAIHSKAGGDLVPASKEVYI